MLIAQPVELVEPGVLRLRVLGPVRMVGLESRPAATVLDSARWLLPKQRDLLGRSRPSAQARHVAHIDSLREHELQDGVAEFNFVPVV
jgi:hypothetical protein